MRGVVKAVAFVLIWTLASCSQAGCSHYGYADREAANDGEQDEPVSVWTVATPADEGLDAASLTRALSGAMRRRGLNAQWQEAGFKEGNALVSLRCSVSDTEVRGLDQALFASAQVRCELGKIGDPPEQFEASGRYVTSGVDGASALVQTHAELQQAAALDALERVVDRIARRHTD